MSQLPIVTLQGSAWDRGQTHGQHLAPQVAANIAIYRDRMRQDAGLSDAQIAHRCQFYLDVFTELDPDYRAAMDGIAAGSGQSLQDIAMLNARFELLYSAWSEAGAARDVDECTAFGIRRTLSSDNAVRIGQNWDWFPGINGALLMWADDDLTTVAYTEAGVAGAKIGLNSAGIGLCVNGLSSNLDDWERGGVPYHLRTSRILGSRSLNEAIGHASVDPPACSANYLIGSSTGEIVDIESSPAGANRLTADDVRVMVHANHFVDPDALRITQRWNSSPITTFHRAQRLEKLMEAQHQVAHGDIEAALADHEGGILGLCRHPDAQKPPHLRTHTAFSAIIDLDALTMHYTQGPPCESGYERVGLAALARAHA